jgi:methylmalonyl-CoA mutase
MRLAAPFESLRDRSDEMLKSRGARPKIFLANLGSAADFTARATFAKSFFETGGIEAIDVPAEASPASPLPPGERSTLKASGEGAVTSGRGPSPAPAPSAPERPLPMGEVKDFSALAAAFKSSGASLACLCSSDKVYAEKAVAAAQALQAAGASHIYLAGRPGEQEAALRDAGVGDFIFAGGDALAMLQQAWQRMERT